MGDQTGISCEAGADDPWGASDASRPENGSGHARRWRDEVLNLSIVIPAYNEAVRMTDRAGLLNKAVAEGDIDPFTTELIVVDDGSTDETARLAERLLAPVYPRLRILQMSKNSGKGAAIRVGAGAAAAPFVAFMDADMSVDPAQVPLLVAAMEGAHVAIGSRAMADSNVQSSRRHRVIMGRTFNFLANAATNIGLKDTQCGFKAFRTPVARILFHLMVIDRFAFDVDVLTLARQLGMEICEVPVEWEDSDSSTVRPMSDSMSMAIDVLRIRWRRKRPQIPALMVDVDAPERESVRNRIIDEAFSTFRQTDPILRLTEDRALVLLPLCRPDEVDGAAARLSQPSTKLTVSRQLVSCDELIDMMPMTFAARQGLTQAGGRDVARDRSERRHVSHSAGHIRRYPKVTAPPLSRLEA
jgi:dolichyl-phosphate beta-glucosyltransferase